MRCAACRRPLTNPVSLQHGLGPDCLKKAVKAGSAPLQYLEELTTWQRQQTRQRRQKPTVTEITAPLHDALTADLFETARAEARRLLEAAATDCRSYGLKVTVTIEN